MRDWASLDDLAVGLAEVAAQVGDHGSDLSEIVAGLGKVVARLSDLVVGLGQGGARLGGLVAGLDEVVARLSDLVARLSDLVVGLGQSGARLGDLVAGLDEVVARLGEIVAGLGQGGELPLGSSGGAVVGPPIRLLVHLHLLGSGILLFLLLHLLVVVVVLILGLLLFLRNGSDASQHGFILLQDALSDVNVRVFTLPLRAHDRVDKMLKGLVSLPTLLKAPSELPLDRFSVLLPDISECIVLVRIAQCLR